MPNPTPEQRLNCMALAGLYIPQQEYIKTYRGSMVNVVVSQPDMFPTLAKFKGQPDSPEFRKELKRVFGFSNFEHTDWLCRTRAQIDLEDYARAPQRKPSLWSRIKDSINFGVDP